MSYAPLVLLDLLHWSKGRCEVVVFLIKETENLHRDVLKAKVRNRGFEFRHVPIPVGSREEEIWEVFNAVANDVHGGSGFRGPKIA